MTPIELVEEFIEQYDTDPIKTKAIIKCESGDTSTDLNTIEDYQRTIPNQAGLSTASGYAQFLDGTWDWTIKRMGLPKNTDKHDPILSIKAFVWLLATDGDRHWLESKPCWSTYLQDEE